ncbi:ATP-binding protein [Bacillus amyloliquefaciens]|uniref:ATP-binding protein n=1 Tax=Bacillus amyloliquefaciens TaxID=1390 RepID=UPI002809D63F|nr:ATP-binding protein [Bacillus amyloliquefaciens]MDQ8094896.1 ATP-binding protein [Bacillus amyloliquefaciens]
MDIQANVKAIYKNIAFTKDNRFQAWYEFMGFHSHLESEQEMMAHFDQLRRLFRELKRELHLVVVPVRTSLSDIHEKYQKEFRGNLKEVAYSHSNAVFDFLETSSELGQNENDVRYFVGVELGSDTIKDSDDDEEMSLKEAWEFFKEFFSNLTSKATGADINVVSENQIRSAERVERNVKHLLQGFNGSYNRLNDVDMAEVLSWIFNFGVRHLPFTKFKDKYLPVYDQYGDVVAFVLPEQEILELQMTGIENHSSRRHLVLHQTDGNGRNLSTRVAFLHVTEFPVYIDFPETRWLESLSSFDFPVGASIKMTYQDTDKRLNRLRRKKDNLTDQANHLSQFNEAASDNVYQGISIADETISEVEKSREPSYLMSAIFIVSASTEEQLNNNIREVIETYSSEGIKLQNTYGLQLKSLMECLPGSPRYITQFLQDIDVNGVTASYFGVKQKLGDPYGAYAGFTDKGQAVFHLPGRAASGKADTQSLVQVFTGKTGGGKSMAANNILYETALYGGRVMLLDPKKERKNLLHWDERLTELGTELNFIDFTGEDEDAGKLDPFLIFPNLRDAMDIAKDTINYLLNISVRVDAGKSALVTKAVKKVAERKQPGMRFVKEELRNLTEEDGFSEEQLKTAKELASTLEQFETVSLSRLMFAEPKNPDNYLNYNKQFNILQIDQLELPDRKKDPKDYSERNIISVALLFSLTSYMIQFMRTFENELTVIALDEAWNFLKTSAGENLLDKLFREGRSLLAPILLMTQNVSDIPEGMRGQIGSAFCFKADSAVKGEIQAIQSLLGIDDSWGLESTMPKLKSGWCVYKDLDKRVGVMCHRILQDHLYQAFDTSKDLTKIAAEGGM